MSKKDISKYYIDENVARLIAIQTIILVIIFFYSHWTYLLLVLTIDFGLRAFSYYPSPLALIAKALTRALKLKTKLVFAAPKKFAAGVGFIFSLAIFLLAFFKYYTGAYAVGSILIIFAFLEATFKICMGCYVYNLLVVPIINKRNN